MSNQGKGALRIAFENWWDDINPSKRFGDYINDRVKVYGDMLLNLEHDIIRKTVNDETLKAYLLENFSEPPEKGNGILYFPMLIGVAILSIVHVFGAGVGLQNSFTQQGWRLYPTNRPTIENLIRLYYRGQMDEDLFKRYALDYGYDKTEVERIIQANLQLTNSMETITLYRREVLSEIEFYERMKANGYEKIEADRLLEVTKIIPGVQDLIRLQVREAWDEETIKRFEYDSGDRTQVNKWAKIQGMDEEWIRRYWVSHWDLPGLSLAYDMLHRLRPGKTDNPFTKDDLLTLIKTADYAPFFRERMMEVSYAVYTRVDLRRMYKLGVLDRDQLIDGYMDLGYEKDKAEHLADFADELAAPSEQDLTRADIESLYRDGFLDEGKATDQIKKLGYDAEEAKLIIARVNLTIAKQDVADEITYLQESFLAGVLSESDVRGALGSNGIAAKKVDGYMLAWSRQKEAKNNLPTKADLDKFFTQNIIDETRYKSEMQKLHYSDEYIGWYFSVLSAKQTQTGG